MTAGWIPPSHPGLGHDRHRRADGRLLPGVRIIFDMTVTERLSFLDCNHSGHIWWATSMHWRGILTGSQSSYGVCCPKSRLVVGVPELPVCLYLTAHTGGQFNNKQVLSCFCFSLLHIHDLTSLNSGTEINKEHFFGCKFSCLGKDILMNFIETGRSSALEKSSKGTCAFCRTVSQFLILVKAIQIGQGIV